jgi:hypothetical protein
MTHGLGITELLELALLIEELDMELDDKLDIDELDRELTDELDMELEDMLDIDDLEDKEDDGLLVLLDGDEKEDRLLEELSCR